ncbi:CDP-diacylglycerol--serine O-phosphatidyltransferase [Fredinandcohnia quinoae]|uniref:CDP-diacylglycerol--serine O-phosphatidyltransferase n=1 Tax=Fredinandcohnia quinoae TaxID=2918902 RepID=A0AAW5E3B6_9BACI|nr:CDP-diacylglycerol--serine O-phosphatidyltransferase [Fredinandcohnia sp. SECRCQ15]MCH1624582.1 CDP-diacylglycerol--serine O-phosphatidyltransferase [Fredinandcohnia sp. SECRCQ15]
MKRHIPNLLTFGNLFCGFLSIGYIINGDSKNATILIFIALMLDALDGRVARILGVSNDIGKELDSLADIVSFGVAPAFLVAHSYYADFGMYGLVAASLFPIFGSYRLARFNISSQDESLKHFKGVPITLAGGIVAFLVLFEKSIALGVFILIYYSLCILMVSTIKIPSFKKIGLPKNSVLITLFLIYMFYLIADKNFAQVPIFYHVALGTYILFIIVRYIKEKETRFPKTKRLLAKRFKLISKRKKK